MSHRPVINNPDRGTAIKHKFIAHFIAILCILSLNGWIVFADEYPKLVKIEEGVYARIVKPEGNAVSNAGIVVLYDSVLIFDTHFTPEAGKELMAAVRSITDKPVRYVVNSHWHADHTHGNQVFADAHIIGSTVARRGVLENDLPSLNRTIGITQKQLERLRADVKAAKSTRQAERLRDQIRARENYLQNMSQLKITAPLVTLENSLAVQEGSSEILIRYLGSGDTEGACILWLPFRKIAFVGDLVFVRAIPNVQNAEILQWMETLKEVLALDAETYVPGHGEIGSKSDVQAFLDYLLALKSMVQTAIDRGDTMEQATRDIRVPEEFSSYMFQNFFPSNVQKMYTEIKALQLLEESEEE
jgi:glyoxylase-like metal-dependent hydrolase (beta-lactamase superfamily II)